MAKIAMRVDLPEDGEGKFVNIANPLHLRRKEMRALEKNKEETDAEYGDRFLKTVVMGGNIAAEDGRSLSYPLSDDDMEELTNYHVISVMNAYKEAIEGVTEKN